MFILKTDIANKGNYGGKRNTGIIKYIVVHYTANDGDTDEGNANYFQNHLVRASAHYFVDDNSATQSVPDNYVAWAVGGTRYSNYLQTGGGKFYGLCTNNNSISIELCDTVKNGSYGFTEDTMSNAIELIKRLMKLYHIDTNHVIRHFDVTGKNCPAPLVDNAKWSAFKSRLEETEVVEKIKMIVNGQQKDVDRILVNGTNYIKIRDIADSLGFNISNNGSIPVLTKK